MPDEQDYAALRDLLARVEQWTEADVAYARMLRKSQAATAAGYDQRDRKRVSAMWGLVRQLDAALGVWESKP